MFSPWSRWPLWRKILLTLSLSTVLGVVAFWFWLRPNGLAFTGDIEPYVLERKGSLIEHTEDAPPEIGKSFRLTSHRLTSSSGLVVEILVREPLPAPKTPPPLVILIGGFNSGRDALRYVEDPGAIMMAGVSYPYRGDRDLDGLGYLAALRELRLSMHDTPAALMLSLDFLFARGGFDPDRVELVGISLGSILVCATAPIETRVSRAWSIHGGAGLSELFDATLANGIPNDIVRAPLVAFGNALVQRLDPSHHVAEIAPRELVVINGSRDRAIPRSAAVRLYETANQPKEMIWLDTEHVHPTRKALIRELLDLVAGEIALPHAYEGN